MAGVYPFINQHSVSLLFVFLLLLSSLTTNAQAIRYVSTTGTNTNPATATSWATSTTDLQGAINASASGDVVWVKGGTYKPTSTADRTVSFAMKNGVGIYGGFAGTETALSQRPPINPVAQPGIVSQPSSTTLSGDIDNDGTGANNSYHVISNPTSLSLTLTALLDGVVITGGNADGSSPNNRGGGVYNGGGGSGNTCQPTFRNCTFQTNSAAFGGVMFNSGLSNGSSSPQLTNCALLSNSATTSGGAFYNDGANNGSSSPRLTNCVFQSNSAASGGAMINDGGNGGSSSPLLTNCSFQSNLATSGGAMFNNGRGVGSRSSPVLTNCSFQSNSATTAGAMANDGGDGGSSIPVLTNCSFQSNSATTGGAVYNYGSAGSSRPVLTNCSFQSNSATTGGAMYNYSSFGSGGSSIPVLTNCSFQSNSATTGGAMANYGGNGGNSSPVLANCSFQSNSATTGGAMYNYGNGGSSSPVLTNSVLWNNGGSNSIVNDVASVVARYSLFDNTVTSYSGSANLTTTVSPFVSATSVALYACSPAINAGNPTSVTTTSAPYSETALPATDLAGGPRIVGGRVDMGAVEFTDIVSPVLYVTPAGNGLRNGSSWANAYVGAALQMAINQASGCNAQVWVAGGTYKPTSTADRTVSFAMKSGVGIYGGFAGTETALSQRPPINPVAEPGMVSQPSSTTLSGDIDNDGTGANNSYHVISNPASLSLTPTALLDGVVVSGGNANGTSPDNTGGGVYNGGSGSGNTCQPTFRNCTFQTNSATFGGAMYNSGSLSGSSSPQLTNCALLSNSATTSGGAVYNDGSFSGISSPKLTNCAFQSNSATSGGAMVNNGERGGSSPQLTNCSLQSNSASNGGGALVNYGDRGISSPLLTNSVLWNNGGSNAIVNFSGSTVVARYCLFDNPANVDISGPGNLTTTTSPFASTATVRLRTGSPAINTGDPATTTATTGSTDLTGLPRFAGGRVDMGAVEFQDEIFTVKTGSWSDTTVWNVNRLPQPGDRARLKHAVTIPASYPAFVTSLLYDPAGRLIYNVGGRLQLGQ